MNTPYKISSDIVTASPDNFGSLGRLCRHCYAGVLRRLDAVKSMVEQEFGRAMGRYQQVLRAEINEAEALAWQTPYPHLFFPALAEEKAAGAQQWAAHQRAILAGAHAVTAGSRRAEF